LSPQIRAQISGDLHDGGRDAILFDPAAVTGPITLSGTHLELNLPSSTASLLIEGGSGVTLDGHKASRLFQLDGGTQATFSHLTFTNGMAPDVGGAIRNLGTLTLADSTLSANTATYGGIYNDFGGLTLTNCTVRGNAAAGQGGGIYNNNGLVTVTNSTLSGNAGSFGGGGAIYNASGTVTVTNSTVRANSSSSSGGGIYNSSGSLSLLDSTVNTNSAPFGAGIYTSGRLTLTGSTISGNISTYGGIYNDYGGVTMTNCIVRGNAAAGEGGGIYNSYGTVNVNSSTLNGNAGNFGGGGGIYNAYGTLTVNSTTLSGNSAPSSGGGLTNQGGTMTVTSSTISANSAGVGGGILNAANGMLTLRNAIVAGNSGPDISGRVQTTSSYSLVGSADSTFSGISNGSQGNLVGTPGSPIDPLLAPLGDYGGPTWTMPPYPTSPALDAGDPAQAGVPDQRGLARTGGINVGAFQASAALMFLTAPDYATAEVPFSVKVNVFDPFGQPANGYTGTVYLYAANDTQASFPAPYTFDLDDGGEAFLSGVRLGTAGRRTLVVTDLSLSATALVHVPGTAIALTFTIPTQVKAGVPFDLEVAAYDRFGDVATGYTGTVELTRSDGQPPVDYTFTAHDAGAHSFSILVTQPGMVTFSVHDRDNPNLTGDRLVETF
jgi:hypothetical protein